MQISIPEETIKWIAESMGVHDAMKENENRADWWEADDIAEAIANTVYDLISEQTGANIARIYENALDNQRAIEEGM